MSAVTYVAAGVGMMGGVTEDLPFVPTCEVALASSFVNRVTPANVGGMALNVRYMQKAGIPPAEAVTGVGLNVVAGGIVHVGLLAVFLAWAGRGDAGGFSIPASSTLLVGIVVVLAIVGFVLATRWGRELARAHVLPPVRQSLPSIVSLARSPSRLAALFGGSIGVTLAYIAALACAVNAFDGGLSLAEVGAVYLGASLLAAAAPTPGGLGAMEAALVAGLHRRRPRPGDRRGHRPQLPPPHVLAADPPRLAVLPAPRPQELHLTSSACPRPRPPDRGCAAQACARGLGSALGEVSDQRRQHGSHTISRSPGNSSRCSRRRSRARWQSPARRAATISACCRSPLATGEAWRGGGT